jgi:hypothetical protein
MRIACLGGGPAGLYFAIAMKLRNPAHETAVFERNKAGDTAISCVGTIQLLDLGRRVGGDPERQAAVSDQHPHEFGADIAIGAGYEDHADELPCFAQGSQFAMPSMLRPSSARVIASAHGAKTSKLPGRAKASDVALFKLRAYRDAPRNGVP